MLNVFDSNACPVCKKGNTELGLQWVQLETAPPPGSIEIINEKLSNMLLEKTVFSAKELKKMKLSNLSENNYIKITDNNQHQYRLFKPVRADYEEFGEKLIHSLLPSTITKYVPAMKVIEIIARYRQYPPLFDMINTIVVDALRLHNNTRGRIQLLLIHEKMTRNFELMHKIHDCFTLDGTALKYFNEAVDSNKLIQLLWSVGIPRVSEHYDNLAVKRRRHGDQYENTLAIPNNRSNELYNYLFPTPQVFIPSEFYGSNSNLRHQKGEISIEKNELVKQYTKCKREIAQFVRSHVPRSEVTDGPDTFMYMSCCEQDHQVCLKCALDLEQEGKFQCPQCSGHFKMTPVDPPRQKKISEMHCWDGLYIKLFDLRCPCYVVVTLCQKNNDYIKNCVKPYRYQEIQRINEIPTGYHQAQIKTYEKKCLSQPGGSTYDVHCFGMQCFLNAKLRVDLFGGGAMVPDGITVQVTRMFSRTRDSKSNDDIPNQETETSVFDGNACELIDEDNVDLIRRNVSVYAEFKNRTGRILQAVQFSFEKLKTHEFAEIDKGLNKLLATCIRRL